MALKHYGSGQPIDLRALSADLQHDRTVALFKADNLEVIRVVLRAGMAQRKHHLGADVTLQCLTGDVTVSIDGDDQPLRAGEMLLVSRHRLLGVEAVTDACLLVTMALPH